jgi:integrase
MASVDKRRGKWRAQVRRNGHTLTRTFARKMDADAWAREAEIALDQERDPTARRVSRKDTFASLIDLHIEDLGSHGKPIRRSKRAVLRRLREELGDLPVAHLTRERLIKYGRDRAREGAGPATRAIDISFIGTILTHAAALHGMTADTEAVRLARVALSKIGLIGRAKERDRRPTQDELDKLFDYFDAKARLTMPMARIVKFAIATAMRQDEIFRIEWRHLDVRNRVITILDRKDPREKIGNDQRVPLLSATGYDAYALLIDQRTESHTSSRCFPYNGKSAGTAFTRACRDLQIRDLHFHDLRHEGTSRLFEAGLSIEQVPLVTGHKDWKMLKRYTQLRPENLHALLSAKAGVVS